MQEKAQNTSIFSKKSLQHSDNYLFLEYIIEAQDMDEKGRFVQVGTCKNGETKFFGDTGLRLKDIDRQPFPDFDDFYARK